MLEFTLQLGQLEHEIKRIQNRTGERSTGTATRRVGMDKDNDASRKITFKAKNTLTKQATTTTTTKTLKAAYLRSKRIMY